MQKLLFTLLIAVLLMACTPSAELGTPFQKGQEVTISASIGEQQPQFLPGLQRISGQDAGEQINLVWNEGDEIEVKVGDHTSVFTLVAGANTGNGTFMGIMPANGTRFSVQYPTFTPNLTTQQYVIDGFDKDLMRMTTQQDGTINQGFTLVAKYAILGLQFAGDAVVSKIVLTNIDTQQTYTLDCSRQTVSTAHGTTLFYIVVPAGTWPKGMTVDVYNADGILIETKTKNTPIDFIEANALMMNPLNLQDVTYKVIDIDGITFRMIYVEGGTFTMGTDDPNAPNNEKPAHLVTLSDYYMAETHVSQALWTEIMGTKLDEEVQRNNGQTGLGKGPNYPMYCITWFQANDFAAKLSERTGLRFRLPTEAEWEYAARGGKKSKGYTYAGSNNLDEVAWWGDPKGLVHESALLLPNELGIYDMCGNICEWTADGFSNYPSEHQYNPCVPQTDSVVQRSMSSHNSWKEKDHRITYRYKKDPNHARTRVGIRLVLETDYVDLGLSVKWARCNVGASKPEEYGDYFAWGETTTKDKYTWQNYKWCDGDYTKLNKYCTRQEYGQVDNQTTLQLCDDAAYIILGENWRMPNVKECNELVNQCTWTWTTINGINGHIITGPNGNSIFLPATGAITKDGLQNAGESGYYWINSINTTNPYNANDIYNSRNNTAVGAYGVNAFSRYIGRPIRPVYIQP